MSKIEHTPKILRDTANQKHQYSMEKAALDFAPGLLSIQESPPARLPRAVLLSISCLFLFLLIWANVGKLDIIASASGKLVPKSYIQVVQPANSGIVAEILVHEGERVIAGQALVRMDPQDVQADSTELRDQMSARSLQVRRIDAELSGRNLEQEPSDPLELYVQAKAQYLQPKSKGEWVKSSNRC